MSSKYYQQYKSKYQSVKSIKIISRSIKSTFKGEYHDIQIISNHLKSSRHSNHQFTASGNAKVLIIPNCFFNKFLPKLTPGDNCWTKCNFLFQHGSTK